MSIVAETLLGRKVSFSLSLPLTLPRQARILDVGCGDGSWLAFMHSRGYQNLEGTEISSSCGKALDGIGVEFHCGDLLDIDLVEQHYDLIRLEHVLEHISEPQSYLQRIAGLLNEKGVLVITIPTVDSPCFRIVGRGWAPLELPHHLNMFSLKSLLETIDRAGLVVERYQYLPVWSACRTSILERMAPSSTRIEKVAKAFLAN